MNYSYHIEIIKSHFPDLDLLKETEFDLFKNEQFARNCVKTCIYLTNKASKILKQELNFGICYNYTFNASAKVKENHAVITLNLGLIEKLDTIISDSISLFMIENVASMTVEENQIDELKRLTVDYSIYYLFYHELAHIIQLYGFEENNYTLFQENCSNENLFDIKRHIYELDADLFGSLNSAVELMRNNINENNQIDEIKLFNSLTLLLFTTANIIIEFSGNTFKEVYYKKNSHPHPFIRILKCHEQIVGNISDNLKLQKPLFEAVIQRSATMVSQIKYSNERTLDYVKFYTEHSSKMEKYIEEIEEENKYYNELTRHKPKEFIHSFIN